MSYQEIIYEVADRIATITLNRPERLNAWTATMDREVRLGMRAAADDPAVRAIVLTGAGRGFCAGADIGNLSQLSEGQRSAVSLETPAPFDPHVPISSAAIPIFRPCRSQS